VTDIKPNILQRLNAVMQEVDYIQREQKQGMRYKIVSHDKVTGLVRPALVKHGVVYWPSSFDVKQSGNRTELCCQVVFANMDDKNDYIVVDTLGYGIDDQDKGPGKAISYAVKYALLKALGLETGDDPDLEQDVEHKHDRAPHIPPAPPMPSVQGTPGASKAANRSTYDKLVMAIRNAPTTKALQDWHKANLSEIDALPPDWVDELRVEYNDRKHELNKVLA
jgi:hypothetical protein